LSEVEKAKISRRKYLKYGGGIVAVAVVAAAGYGIYEVTKPKPGPVTIKLMMESVPDTDLTQKLVPEFEEATGIKVVIEVFSYAVMHEKLVTILMSTEGYYDVIVVDNPWVGEFDETGWIENLDPFIEKHSEIRVDDYVDSIAWMNGKYIRDGKWYMFPFYNYGLALVYRTDIFQKYGVEVPKTWEEFYEVVKKLTMDTNGDGKIDLYGCAAQAKRGYKIVEEGMNYVYGFGGDIFDENWRPIINSPEAAKALELYKKVVYEASPPGSVNWEFDEAIASFKAGEAATMITYNPMFTWVNEPEFSPNTAGKVGIVPVPGGKAVLGGWGWAVPKNSPHKDAAYEFLAWVANPETERKRSSIGSVGVTRKSTFNDPELQKKHPYYPQLLEAVQKAKPLPGIPQGEQIVHILGEEFSNAMVGAKPTEVALNDCATRLYELMKSSGLYG